MTTAAIDVSGLVKKFGTFTAVNGITFGVEEGEIFGLLGPNGAGKSTLIRMLTTLLPPTAGTARVNGFDVVAQADGVRKSIGVIPQALTSDLELSVEENLIIFAKLYGVPRAKRQKLIAELLEAVELTQWRTAPVKNLSGGMRRRVEIARGLVHEPRIFFLEPHDQSTHALRGSLGCSEDQIPLIHPPLTTHYMDEAEARDRPHVDHGAEGADSPIRLKLSIPLHTRRAEPGATRIGRRLGRLPFVESVSGRGRHLRPKTQNGPHDARAAGGGHRRHRRPALSVRARPRRRVHPLHRTALRDALQEPSSADSPFMIRRA
jgi:ABC-type lipoprotein export system ATPase subunit